MGHTRTPEQQREPRPHLPHLERTLLAWTERSALCGLQRRGPCSLPFSAQVQLSFWLVVGVYVAGWQVTSPAWESGASRSSGRVHSMGKGCSGPAGCVVMARSLALSLQGGKVAVSWSAVTEGHGACEALGIKHLLMPAILNSPGANSHPDHEAETPGWSFEGRDSGGEVGLSA